MVIKEVDCTNGEKVLFEETPSYFKLTISGKTWYWKRDTGEYQASEYRPGEQAD